MLSPCFAVFSELMTMYSSSDSDTYSLPESIPENPSEISPHSHPEHTTSSSEDILEPPTLSRAIKFIRSPTIMITFFVVSSLAISFYLYWQYRFDSIARQYRRFYH